MYLDRLRLQLAIRALDLPSRNHTAVSSICLLFLSTEANDRTSNVRHIGAATATSAEWLTAFLVQEVTPIAVTRIGWKYYILFTCVCLLSIPIVYFFFPETSGKTLEEIDMIFASGTLHHPGSTSSVDEKVVASERDAEEKPSVEKVEVL